MMNYMLKELRILKHIDEYVVYKFDLRRIIEDILKPDPYNEYTKEDLEIQLDYDMKYCMSTTSSEFELEQLKKFEQIMLKVVNMLYDI